MNSLHKQSLSDYTLVSDKRLKICLIIVSQEISYYRWAIAAMTHQSLIRHEILLDFSLSGVLMLTDDADC